MKNIITAIGSYKINEELKTEYNVICRDIRYKEGILEQLEKNKNIDFIILNEKIDGEISIDELTKKVKLLNKKCKIIKISETQKITKEEIIKLIKNNELKKENKKLESNQKNNKIDEYINNNTIIITGSENTGKTVVSVLFAFMIEKEKILLIDYNPTENQNTTVLLKKRKRKNNIKINKNIDLFISNNIQEIIKYLKKSQSKYERVIIDTRNFLTQKEINFFKNQKIVILVEPTVLGIKKAQKIAKQYISKSKNIYLLINKQNKYSINTEVLKSIFKGIKLLGAIKLNDKFDKMINKYFVNIETIVSKKEKILVKKI